MRRILISTAVILLVSGLSNYVFAVSGENFEYHGYFRSGIGSNSKGGDQTCFSNGGNGGGNEFRIGNECTTYGEVAFTGHHLKGKGPNAPFFKSQFRMAFEVEAHSDYEQDQGDKGPAFREVYVEGGNLDGIPLSYWAGKRFYRDQDAFISDWYYMSDLSAPGAGFGNIPFLGLGKAHIAYIKRVDDSAQTDIGYVSHNVYDLRIKDIKIPDLGSVQLWLAYANNPSSRNLTNGTTYSDNEGLAGGFLFSQSILGGFNNFSIVYGRGLMQGLNIYGTTLTEYQSDAQYDQEDSSRIRIVDHATFSLSPELELHGIAAIELRDNGSLTDSKENWYSIGVQPVYKVTDHYQLVSVLGHSQVEADKQNTRRLTRFTLAPQVTAGRSIWARPVFRVFYTRTWWNEANKGRVESGTSAYRNTDHASSWGFQGEVWF
ncbi:MAG: carbohydrate porin [Bacteriovoracaceae bacterium]